MGLLRKTRIVSGEEMNAVGCRYLNWVLVCGTSFVGGSTLLPAESTAATPAFAKDIAPIIYQHCASCHRTGQIPPMALLSYDEERPWATSIGDTGATGAMPPGHSAGRRGQVCSDR